MVGRHEQAGDAIDHRFGYAANGVRDHGQAVGSRFEVDQAETLYAVAVVNAGHRKDVGVGINLGEFVVGQISKKTYF